MKNNQDNTGALSALLRTADGVDTLVTNSLCCAAAGIIASSSATAEALIPHEKLRGAALADATLNAKIRPLAQPVVGYTHTSKIVDYPPEAKPVRGGCMSMHWKLVPVDPTETMVINGFESEPDECFSDEEAWEQYQEMSGCQQAAYRAKLCWAAMLAAAPVPPQVDAQPVAYAVFADNGNIRVWSRDCEAVGIKVMQDEGKQAVPLYTRPNTDEADDLLTATSLEFGERLETLEKERNSLRAQLAERDMHVTHLVQSLGILLPYAENEAAGLNCDTSADKAWAAVEEARELLSLIDQHQSSTARTASAEPATCCSCGAHPAGRVTPQGVCV